MDELLYLFPVSGVETYVFVPPLVMFFIATLSSLGGVTGAFALLPFNMSVLGYTAPGVSATNFVYNVVAVPLGAYRHIRAGRMLWPLFWILFLGTLPGVVVGYVIRVQLLPDPAHFKPFVGAVLAYLTFRLLQGLWQGFRPRRGGDAAEPPAPPPTVGRITNAEWSLRRVRVWVGEQTWEFATLPLVLLALVLGVVGGAYGIGGGAVAAPFCIAVLGLPAFVVAGATLMATWAMSCVGALVYTLMPGNASPDWLLGALYGVGGMAGIYLGARLQGLVPERLIKLILAIVLGFVAVRYLWHALG